MGSIQKNISVKKKTGYYVIHYNTTVDTSKVPFEPADGKKLNKKIKNNVHSVISLSASGIKSGNVYLDNLTIKAGTKTISNTFEKKDYRGWGYQPLSTWKFYLNSKKAKVVASPLS